MNLAEKLTRAIARAMDHAGTMPAKDAVKIHPNDWRTVVDHGREAAALIASQAARIRELEEVYDAARGLCYGEDWNNGTHAKSRCYRQKLVAAVNAIEPLPPLLPRKGGE